MRRLKIATISCLLCFLLICSAQAEGVAGLYAGTTDPGVVYYYPGSGEWEAISPPLGYTVLGLVEYKDQLYAATVGRVEGSYSAGGRVYRYDEYTWTLVGDEMDCKVEFLIVYKGRLYAGTTGNGGRLYRYKDIPGQWTKVVDCSSWCGMRCGFVWDRDGLLYLGDVNTDLIGRFNGKEFTELANFGGSCIWDLTPFGDALYACAFDGRLYRSTDGTEWEIALDYIGRNIWEMQEFVGYLYYGTDWLGGEEEGQGAQLWRYDGEKHDLVWTLPVAQLGEGIISMAADGQRLFIGTGRDSAGSSEIGGRVYCFYGNTKQPSLISSSGLGKGVQVLYCASIVPMQLCKIIIHDPRILTIAGDYHFLLSDPALPEESNEAGGLQLSGTFTQCPRGRITFTGTIREDDYATSISTRGKLRINKATNEVCAKLKKVNLPDLQARANLRLSVSEDNLCLTIKYKKKGGSKLALGAIQPLCCKKRGAKIIVELPLKGRNNQSQGWGTLILPDRQHVTVRLKQKNTKNPSRVSYQYKFKGRLDGKVVCALNFKVRPAAGEADHATPIKVLKGRVGYVKKIAADSIDLTYWPWPLTTGGAKLTSNFSFTCPPAELLGHCHRKNR